MFQDDRMIPVLTAVLLMVVVGTFLQRADRDAEQAKAGPEVVQLVDDQVTAPAGALVRIDALANDTGITDEMRATLTVVTSPACGRLFVRNGVFEYMAGEACSGRQTIRYTVTGAPDGQLATVTARIRGGGLPVNRPPAPAKDTAPAVAAASSAPATPSAAPLAAVPADAGSAGATAVATAAPPGSEAGRVQGVIAAGTSKTPPAAVASAAGATDVSAWELPISNPPGTTASAAVAEGSPSASGEAPPTPGAAAVATSLATAPGQTSGSSDPTPGIAGIASAPASELPTEAPLGSIARSEPNHAAAALPGAEAGAASEIASGAAVPAGPSPVIGAPGGTLATASAAPGAADVVAHQVAASPLPAAAAPDDPPRTAAPTAGIAAAADNQPDLAASGSPRTTAGDTSGTGLATPDAAQQALAEMAAPDSAQERAIGATPSAPGTERATGPAMEPEQRVAMTSAPTGHDRGDAAAPAGTESVAEVPPEPQMMLASLAPPARADSPALPGGPGAPVRIVSPAAMHGSAAAAGSGSGVAPMGQDPAGPPDAVTQADAASPGHAGAAVESFMMTVAGRTPYSVPPAPPVARGIGDAPAPVLPAAIAPGARAANAASNAPRIARLTPTLSHAPQAVPSLALPGLPMVLPPPRPSRTAGEGEVRTARLDPGAISGATPGETTIGGTAPERVAPATGGTRLARLPDQTASCLTAPAMTLEVHTAGETVVSVTAPCHASTVAELSYSGLRFAVPIDGEGHGRITALGFEPNAPALLRFADGGQIDFDLPFKGVGRVSRVALAWEKPVDLALNALEYDAAPYSAGHVAPRRPRSFDQVRRTGGGWLSTYHAAAGVGQNVQVYSWWHRQGEEPGVVRLLVDFVSRQLGAPGTCGNGAAAAPQFLVLRSEFGRPERPVLRQLAPVDCASIQTGGDESLISGAVEDLVITDR